MVVESIDDGFHKLTEMLVSAKLVVERFDHGVLKGVRQTSKIERIIYGRLALGQLFGAMGTETLVTRNILKTASNSVAGATLSDSALKTASHFARPVGTSPERSGGESGGYR